MLLAGWVGLRLDSLAWYYDIHSLEAIAKAAALSFKELAGPEALAAPNHDLKLGGIELWCLLRDLLDDFSTMILSQPGRELHRDSISIFRAEMLRHLLPPGRHTTEANDLPAIKERTLIGTAEELVARGTAFYAKQCQGLSQILEVMLDLRNVRK